MYRHAVEATAGLILTFQGEAVRASSLRLTQEGARSFCYVAKNGREFVMSQEEAEGLAQEGKNFREILSQFFSESELANFE